MERRRYLKGTCINQDFRKKRNTLKSWKDFFVQKFRAKVVASP